MENKLESIDSSKLPNQESSLILPPTNQSNEPNRNDISFSKPPLLSKENSGEMPVPVNLALINKQTRTYPGDDSVLLSANPNSPSIALLARGMKLLSIANLRQLLRIYSLPTGGNKKSLVDRLILYLETLGPNQQAMVMQFSVNLKKLLSNDDSTTSFESEPEHNSLMATDSLSQMEASKSIPDVSPTILYSLSNSPPPFVPQTILSGNISSSMIDFALINPPPECTAILQFVPTYRGPNIRSITVQFSNRPQVTLQQNALWISLSDFINQNGLFRINAIDPPLSVTVIIRWVKKVPLADVMQAIIKNEEAPCEVNDTLPSKYPINGICPATRKIIKYPVRGVDCMHKDCVDLSGYLSIGSDTNQWICPICSKTLYPDDLRIDPQYLLNVSNSITGK